MRFLQLRLMPARSVASTRRDDESSSARAIAVVYGPMTRFLAGGLIGRVARFAVSEYPYVARGDATRIRIGPNVVLNNALLNCWGGDITVSRDAFFGHGVLLLAGTHDYRKLGVERQHALPADGHDITIGEGAWIASNVTVLGPCAIGEHAVVAAGSVVTSDVPPYTIAGGIPARVIKPIEGH